jgi:serine phosphatase RsbU (regulator of sigma subunit)
MRQGYRIFRRLSVKMLTRFGIALICFVVVLSAWDLWQEWSKSRQAIRTLTTRTAENLAVAVAPLLWNMDQRGVDSALRPLLSPGEVVGLWVYELDDKGLRRAYSQATWSSTKRGEHSQKAAIISVSSVIIESRRIGEVEVWGSVARADERAFMAGLNMFSRTVSLVALLWAGIFVIRRQRAVSLELSSSRDRVRQALRGARLARRKAEEQHGQILASLHYGKLIQSALLPKIEEMWRYLPELEVLYRPRDIVSGDFYWFVAAEEEVFLAVGDCTGHGVPGAFMSMIGSALLNQIVLVDGRREPAEILERLDQEIRKALKQDVHGSEADDGMDLGLCRIEKGAVTFTGAHRPLYYFQGGQLEQVKGDRRGVGGRSRAVRIPYTSNTIFTAEPTAFFLTTDGLVDQAGPGLEKFGSRRLQEVLQQHGGGSMGRCLSYLDLELRQHQQGVAARDDMALIAFRHDPEFFQAALERVAIAEKKLGVSELPRWSSSTDERSASIMNINL